MMDAAGFLNPILEPSVSSVVNWNTFLGDAGFSVTMILRVIPNSMSHVGMKSKELFFHTSTSKQEVEDIFWDLSKTCVRE